MTETLLTPEVKPEMKVETTLEAKVAPEVKTATDVKSQDAKIETKPDVKVEAKAEPIKYDLKKPEGTTLTDSDVQAVLAQAKEKNLTNEQAQLLLEAKSDGAKTYAARELQKIKDDSPKWVEAMKSEYKEDFKKTIENASRVVSKYADKEFKDFLDNSGLGNNPMVVRLFAKIGKAFGEDHWVDGNPSAPKKEVSKAEKMYDKTT